jgi:hypothetical protein
MILRPPRAAASTVVDLQPSVVDIERGERAPTAEVTVLLTKKNRIAIQDPAVEEYCEAIDPKVLAELGLRWPNPRFFAVAGTVTCLPDPSCRFTFVRIALDLGPELPRQTRPVACGLYPESGEHTVQVVETAETTANLGFKVKGVETPSVGQKEGVSTTHERRYYSIVAFGRNGPSPGWDFKRTPVSDEIAGDLDILLIVSAGADVQAEAQISISANVELRSSEVSIPFLTSRQEADIARLRFRIT